MECIGFLLFGALVAVFSISVVALDNIKKLANELRTLRNQVTGLSQELSHRNFSAVDEGRQGVPPSPEVFTPAAVPADFYAPAEPPPQTTMPVPAIYPVQAPVASTTSAYVGSPATLSYNPNFNEPFAPNEETEWAESREPVYSPVSTQKQREGADNFCSQTGVPLKSEVKPSSSVRSATENLFGRNVLGIAASVLIFLGLFFLGVLVYEHLTDLIKVICLFSISATILAVGLVLNHKKQNIFTTILTGCGIGSFFISILLTHIHFEMLNNVVAFSLLLVWMVFALYLAKRYDSAALSVVAHIGMIISICLAYAGAELGSQLALILLYQVASTIVIVVGGMLCCKKTYRFSLFVSLALTLVASAFMWLSFQPYHGAVGSVPFGLDSPPIWMVSLAFIVQFVGASVLSYLLSVSTNRHGTRSVRIALHLGNTTLWIFAFFANLYFLVWRLAYYLSPFSPHSSLAGIDAANYAGIVAVLVLAAYGCFMVFRGRARGFDKELETISTIVASGIMALVLLVAWFVRLEFINVVTFYFPPNLSYFLIPALLMTLAYCLTRNNGYLYTAGILIAADFLFMLLQGYHALAESVHFGILGILISLTYLLVYLAAIWIAWWRTTPEIRQKYLIAARLVSLIAVEFSLIAILLRSDLAYAYVILLLSLTTLVVVLFALRYDRNTNLFKKSTTHEEMPNPLYWTMRVHEFALVALNAVYIAFLMTNSTEHILGFALLVLTIALAFMRIRDVLAQEEQSWEELWLGIKLTILMLAAIQGYTVLLEQGSYMLSLVCMLAALICVIAGFMMRKRYLRLYGLVLTLFCVVKLVTFDVADLDTYFRVIALIGGGIICFTISAIYTYSSKKIESSEASPNESAD